MEHNIYIYDPPPPPIIPPRAPSYYIIRVFPSPHYPTEREQRELERQIQYYFPDVQINPPSSYIYPYRTPNDRNWVEMERFSQIPRNSIFLYLKIPTNTLPNIVNMLTSLWHLNFEYLFYGINDDEPRWVASSLEGALEHNTFLWQNYPMYVLTENDFV